jgi:acyl carrier protein
VADLPAARISPGARLREDLEIDSMSIVELVAIAESEFGIDLPNDELRDLVTVGDAAEAIQRRLANLGDGDE